MKALDFLLLEKHLTRLKIKIIFAFFCYENNLIYSVHISDEKFKNCMDLLLITDCNRSMSIWKNLTDLCGIRQSVKIKKNFWKYYLQCFSSNRVLAEDKEVRLK